MADETPPAEKVLTLNLEWGNMDSMPIFFSNQALIQNVQNEFILTFGHTTGPMFLKTPTQQEVEALKSVPVTPIFRVAMTPDRLIELIGALELNLRTFQKRTLES
jgi:hypothetical protein